MRYPKNWVTGDCSGSGNVSVFFATVKSNLAVCNSDQPGEMDVMSLAGDRVGEYKGNDTGWSPITVSGTSALVLRETNRSLVTPEYKIAVYKEYVFAKNGRTYVITYMQDTNRGFPDSEKDFTTMVEKTFKSQ